MAGLARIRVMEQGSRDHAFLMPIKLDPRAFFSNERTCLAWLHLSGTLGAFASGLAAVNVPGTRLAAILLFMPAILLVVQARPLPPRRFRGQRRASSASHSA